MNSNKPISLSAVRDAINSFRKIAVEYAENDRSEAFTRWLTGDGNLDVLLTQFREIDKSDAFATTSDDERIQFLVKIGRLVARLKKEYPDAEE